MSEYSAQTRTDDNAFGRYGYERVGVGVYVQGQGVDGAFYVAFGYGCACEGQVVIDREGECMEDD